jgi:hypothetical protein
VLRTPIYADVVWPALILELRLLSILPICVGLLVEWLALCFGGFGLGWKKAAYVDIGMNAASTALGIFAIPLAGLVVIFSPATSWEWPITLIVAILVTTSIESAVLMWGYRIQIDRRRFAVLAVANAVSTIIAFTSVMIHPPRV